MRDYIKVVETVGADPKPVSDPKVLEDITGQIEDALERIRAKLPEDKQPFWMENLLRSALDGVESLAKYLEHRG